MTNSMDPIGKRLWAIAGGNIPLETNGIEPAFTSRDTISILNVNDRDARLKLSVYFENEEPIEPYHIVVKAERVCRIWFNDLIDPLPLNLNKPFSCVIRSDIPVVVQFSRMDTSSASTAITGTIAFDSD